MDGAAQKRVASTAHLVSSWPRLKRFTTTFLLWGAIVPQLLQASRETCLKRTLSVLKKGQTGVSGSCFNCLLTSEPEGAEQHFAFYYTAFVWKVEKFGDRPLAKIKLFPLSVPSFSSSLLDVVIFPDP